MTLTNLPAAQLEAAEAARKVMFPRRIRQIRVPIEGYHVNEANEVLGPPSSRSDTSLTWRINAPRHFNPGVTATVERGKTTEFRRYSG